MFGYNNINKYAALSNKKIKIYSLRGKIPQGGVADTWPKHPSAADQWMDE